MKKKTKFIISAASVFSTVFCTTVAVLYDKMTQVAINRKAPALYKVAHDQYTKKYVPQDELDEMKIKSDYIKNIPSEEIHIKSFDDIDLVGHLIEAENAKRIVIACHGWRSTWYFDFGVIGNFLKQKDCTVLYIEQRAQNSSGGDYMGFGVLERFDCAFWAKYISERFGQNIPVYLYGISMGATTVLMSSVLDLPDNVHGIISDCGFTSPHEIWSHVVKNGFHMTDKIIYPIAKRICSEKAHFDADEASTIDAMKTNKIPVLFIHGGSDTFVPVTMTVENYAACVAPKELFIVPDAGHGASSTKDPDGYKEALEHFFDKYD